MERFDDICPENEFEDKNSTRSTIGNTLSIKATSGPWDALTDGMYGDMPSNPLEYDAMMDAMGF